MLKSNAIFTSMHIMLVAPMNLECFPRFPCCGTFSPPLVSFLPLRCFPLFLLSLPLGSSSSLLLSSLLSSLLFLSSPLLSNYCDKGIPTMLSRQRYSFLSSSSFSSSPFLPSFPPLLSCSRLFSPLLTSHPILFSYSCCVCF